MFYFLIIGKQKATYDRGVNKKVVFRDDLSGAISAFSLASAMFQMMPKTVETYFYYLGVYSCENGDDMDILSNCTCIMDIDLCSDDFEDGRGVD